MTTSGRLGPYLAAATLTRTACETVGPALLIVGIAVLASDSAGPFLVAALTGSAALAGPMVGALLDRSTQPKRGLVLSALLFGLGLSVIALLIGNVPLWLLLVIAAITGLGFPGITGAWTAQLPHIVSGDRLVRAYSADAGTYSLAAIIGPPIAAALLTFSNRAPLWLPVALLLLALIALRFLHIPERERVSTHSLGSDLRNGVRTVFHRTALRQTVVITTVSFMGMAGLFICIPIITTELTGSLALSGVVFAALATGGLVAALITVRRPIGRPDRVVIVFTALNGLCLIAAGFANSFPLLLITCFLFGLTEIPAMSSSFQIRAREASPRVRTQVFTTVSSLRSTAFAAGSALFGATLGLGVHAVILGAFVLYVVALAWGLLVGPRATRRRRDRRDTRTLSV
jgi:MFS family permease